MDPQYPTNPPEEQLVELLTHSQTIAVVGLSTNPEKESHAIARLLKEAGFRVLGVNPSPRLQEVWSPAYTRLSEIPEPVDVADLFLRPELVPQAVEEALLKRVKVLWMQQGIRHEGAARRALEQGIVVVQDLCLGAFVRLHRLKPQVQPREPYP